MARNPCLFKARRLLYVPSALTSTNSAFCQHIVFMRIVKLLPVQALSHMRKWFNTVLTLELNGSVGPLYLGGRSPRCALYKRLDRPPSWSGHFGKQIPYECRALIHDSSDVQPVAWSLYLLSYTGSHVFMCFVWF
jgi:hypothetical protein